MPSVSLHVVQCRRQRICRGLPRQLLCGCSCRRGGAEARRDHARYDTGVLPPVQPARRQAGAEPLQAAAERHDVARQVRPVLMPRPDAVAHAAPADRVPEVAAHRGEVFLRRTRRQVRPSLEPPRRSPPGTKQPNGVQRLRQEQHQHGEPMDEPLRRVCGRLRTGPICIGGEGLGRSRARGAHFVGGHLPQGGTTRQALFPVSGQISLRAEGRHGKRRGPVRATVRSAPRRTLLLRTRSAMLPEASVQRSIVESMTGRTSVVIITLRRRPLSVRKQIHHEDTKARRAGIFRAFVSLW